MQNKEYLLIEDWKNIISDIEIILKALKNKIGQDGKNKKIS